MGGTAEYNENLPVGRPVSTLKIELELEMDVFNSKTWLCVKDADHKFVTTYPGEHEISYNSIIIVKSDAEPSNFFLRLKQANGQSIATNSFIKS